MWQPGQGRSGAAKPTMCPSTTPRGIYGKLMPVRSMISGHAGAMPGMAGSLPVPMALTSSAAPALAVEDSKGD